MSWCFGPARKWTPRRGKMFSRDQGKEYLGWVDGWVCVG